MLSRRQELLAFAAALCLHAIAFSVLRLILGVEISNPPPTTPPVSDLTFDIELGEPGGSTAPQRADPASGDVAAQRLARFVPPPSARDPELDSVRLETPDSLETAAPDLGQS